MNGLKVLRRAHAPRCIRAAMAVVLAAASLCAAAVAAPASSPASTPASTPPVAQPPGHAAPATSPASEATTGPRFSIGNDGVLRLPAANSGPALVVLNATQLGKEDMDAPLSLLEDIPAVASDPGRASFKVAGAVEMQKSGSSRSWIVPATGANMSPGYQEGHFAHAKVGRTEVRFPYTLSARPAGVVDFGASARQQWVVSDDQPSATALSIEARDQPIAGLRLVMSTLAEVATSRPLELTDLELCADPGGKCIAPATVPPQSIGQAYLRWNGGRWHPGVYKGTLSLAADGRGEAKIIAMDVLSSSDCIRAAGMVVIVLGVFLAFWVNVRGRLLSARLTALAIASSLGERAGDLERDVSAAEKASRLKFPGMHQSLRELAASMTESALTTSLPPKWAFYRTFDDTALKKAMSDAETRLAVCTILVRDGVDVLSTKAESDASLRAQAQAIAQTLTDGGGTVDGAAAHALVAPAASLGASQQSQTRQALMALAPMRALVSPPSSSVLVARIEHLSLFAWLLYVLITAGGGIALLVLHPPGFGTWLDFLYCFFWGFGLPTSLDKLQQMTPTTTQSTLSISMPK